MISPWAGFVNSKKEALVAYRIKCQALNHRAGLVQASIITVYVLLARNSDGIAARFGHL
jgi:hypothetical protein